MCLNRRSQTNPVVLENGVFCVMFTVIDLPSPLIMANCAAMITGMMHRGLAKTYMDEQTTEMSNKVH